MSTVLLAWAVVGPALVAVAVSGRGRPADRIGRICSWTLVSAAVASVVLLVATATSDDGVLPGLADLPAWIDLRLDRLSAVLLVAFTLLGATVASFSHRALDESPRTASYHVWLAVVVSGGALVAVPGGAVPLLAGWILSGWALDRLIAGWVDTPAAHAARRRLRAATRAGDVALVAAIVLGLAVAGPELVVGSPSAATDLATTSLLGVGADTLFALLVLVAGLARSALFPFHRWLTATLYAPTPVSALVHAGYVSGAGLLLIRFAPTFTAVDVAVVLAVVLAIATIAVGTAASLTRPDVKGALAWSTVAQMAFMVLQCSIGAFSSAVVHIVGHGMYKAVQFLGAGDTVAAGLQKRRRPMADADVHPALRHALTAAVPTVAVVIGLVVGPPGLDGAERILLVGFAWLAIAAGVRGTLTAGTLAPASAASSAAVGGVVAGVVYFLGLRVAKAFFEPSLGVVDVDATIGETAAVVALVVVAAMALLLAVPGAGRLRADARWWIDRLTEVRPALRTDLAATPRVSPITGEGPHPSGSDPSPETDDVRRAELRAQVARAAEAVAPLWPLSSFVAVNPLGGFEHRSFDDAVLEARRVLRGRGHRSLQEFRDDHRAGVTDDDDLAWAIHATASVACAQEPLVVGQRSVRPDELVRVDLLHGPDETHVVEPRTELERRLGVDAGALLGIDELIASWLTDHVAPPTWPLGAPGDDLMTTTRRQAIRHARRALSAPSVEFLESLGDDPIDVIERSLTASGVRPADCVDELRGHLASLPGWAGHARWRTEWAHADEQLPMVRPSEIAATRAMLEAATIIDLEVRGAGAVNAPETAETTADGPGRTLAGRVDMVIDRLGLAHDDTTRGYVGDVLALVPDTMRSAIWQAAQEHHVDHGTLSLLDRTGGVTGIDGATDDGRPASQVALCIDVRSEGLRRHLEEQHRDETIGFAGFFGIPMSTCELGWSRPEPRCPVLVAPSAVATETPADGHHDDARRLLADRRVRGAGAFAHTSTKQQPGAPFATAEALGWITGPLAAWRTLAPPHSNDAEHHVPPTQLGFDEGVEVDQRVFWAESVLRTMGLTERFARLVVLCGHTSSTVNNPHATALECGACAGASGGSNARAVAALLNQRDVRSGLSERNIHVPDDTWFTGAVHETTTDSVTLLDVHLAPSDHGDEIGALQQRLDLAARNQAADRARYLPGPASRVRDRGLDWAQTRPEWGLARNAAFVIAPRSATLGLDLGGRAFLHSYDSRFDPTGSVLETIMTAPLVVGHWISSQYYFSTVDPDTFGAGDKLLHNPVGTVGVMSGATGDLRVGLPLQSTHVGDRPYHQPLRLLAVVQAEPATIDAIIARNPLLQRLVEGSWLRIAARPHAHRPWSMRSPSGIWTTSSTDITDTDTDISSSTDSTDTSTSTSTSLENS